MGFLGLCDLVSKKRHKATTPNGVPQVKEHDIFQTELIQWLCLFGSMLRAFVFV